MHTEDGATCLPDQSTAGAGSPRPRVYIGYAVCLSLNQTEKDITDSQQIATWRSQECLRCPHVLQSARKNRSSHCQQDFLEESQEVRYLFGFELGCSGGSLPRDFEFLSRVTFPFMQVNLEGGYVLTDHLRSGALEEQRDAQQQHR